MAFTQPELDSIANAALDYYFEKGTAFKQSIAAKPLVEVMERKSKTFSGGKGDISVGIKGNYGAGGTNDTLTGYTHNDQVAFYTPSNIDRANYPWREMHIGMTMTHTELKMDGLSVIDTNGARTRALDGREMHVLVGILDDKMHDLGEQYARSLDDLLHGDGTGDALALAGLSSIVTDDPTTGTVGGIDRATETWWRNRAATTAHAGSGGQGPITSSPNNGGVLIQFLNKEHRQLRKYGGNPDTFLAGADFMDALEVEARANGMYSQTGFSNAMELSMGEQSVKNVTVQYDPWLDDNSLSKRAYWFDSNRIFLQELQNEWRRRHVPARPADQFVLYRSITCTGQVVASQCNSSLVVDIT